jgi:hypothetical protein
MYICCLLFVGIELTKRRCVEVTIVRSAVKHIGQFVVQAYLIKKLTTSFLATGMCCNSLTPHGGQDTHDLFLTHMTCGNILLQNTTVVIEALMAPAMEYCGYISRIRVSMHGCACTALVHSHAAILLGEVAYANTVI